MHERQSGRRVQIGQTAAGNLLQPGLSSSGVTVKNPERDVDISILWEVWDQLNSHYIDPHSVQVTPLVYGAAEGLTRGIGDPYTVFMTPKENTDFHDSLAGNLQGIGAELTARDGLIIVVNPLKGSPAEAAGMRPKDVILKVDGQSTEDWNLGEVVSHIRGPKGTSVKIQVGREASAGTPAATAEFTITRQAIHVPSVESHLIDTDGKTYGYVALNQFGESSISELKKELAAFKNRKVDGIVLDLRNNGGGFLDGAVQLVSFFIREGVVVQVERRGGDISTESVSGNVFLSDMPMVILQNDGTASASEIVSGALQDHHRATIVGTKSFGKGTVQEVIDLTGGASLRVTVARWLTPNGKNLGKEGVHPDVVVENPKPAADQKPDPVGTPWNWGKDVQLKVAVGELTKKK